MSLSKIMNAVSDHIHTHSDTYVFGGAIGGFAIVASAVLLASPPENPILRSSEATLSAPAESAGTGFGYTRTDPYNFFGAEPSIVNMGKRGETPYSAPNTSISPGNMYPDSGYGGFSFD